MEARSACPSRVHERCTKKRSLLTNALSTRKLGTRGGGRTHTTLERQGILSPPRMPFRHPGSGCPRLNQQNSYCNLGAWFADCGTTSVSVVVSVRPAEWALSSNSEVCAGGSNRSTAARVCFGT